MHNFEFQTFFVQYAPNMNKATLAPRALYEEVAELLRQRIFAHQLKPGS